MSIPLHLSPRSAIHGPRPCDECGGPTNYWHAAEHASRTAGAASEGGRGRR